MHPQELWWWTEAHKPKKTFGKMSEDEARALYEKHHGPVED
jgi:hypothetical protein